MKRIIGDFQFLSISTICPFGCHSHLQYGILEVVEVNRFEAFELCVTSTQVVQQWRQCLVVRVNIVNDDADGLHEPQGVIFEAFVRHELLAVEMTETEDGLDERVSTEDKKKYSHTATAEVRRQNLPVFNDHCLVLVGQHDVHWRHIVGEFDIGYSVF